MFAGLRSGGLLAFVKLSRSHCPGPDEAPHCCDNLLKAALSPSALARAAPFSSQPSTKLTISYYDSLSYFMLESPLGNHVWYANLLCRSMCGSGVGAFQRPASLRLLSVARNHAE